MLAAPRGAPKAPPKGQKIALIAVAGAVVVVSLLAVFVVFKGRSVGDATNAVTAASPTATATAAAPAATATTPPTATAAPSNEPASATAEPAVEPAPQKDKAAGNAASDAAPATKDKAASGGDTGTLVAVAVGGTCAFSVNGTSKGRMSTLKVSLKPGTYSVTCAPSSGASKSKSVTVTSGGTGMAMFKL